MTTNLVNEIYCLFGYVTHDEARQNAGNYCIAAPGQKDVFINRNQPTYFTGMVVNPRDFTINFFRTSSHGPQGQAWIDQTHIGNYL